MWLMCKLIDLAGLNLIFLFSLFQNSLWWNMRTGGARSGFRSDLDGRLFSAFRIRQQWFFNRRQTKIQTRTPSRTDSWLQFNNRLAKAFKDFLLNGGHSFWRRERMRVEEGDRREREHKSGQIGSLLWWHEAAWLKSIRQKTMERRLRNTLGTTQ